MVGFPGVEAPQPQPQPQRQNDGIEMGDPATLHHVALYIPVVDEAVRKSDGCTVVEGKHPHFDYCLSWCAKTMLKILFIGVVVCFSFLFIENFATTKMTWTQALQMLVFGALLGVFFLMALVICWPDAACFTVPVERPVERSTN